LAAYLDLIRRYLSLLQRLPRQHKFGHRPPASEGDRPGTRLR
jgi:hypothetical protein